MLLFHRKLNHTPCPLDEIMKNGVIWRRVYSRLYSGFLGYTFVRYLVGRLGNWHLLNVQFTLCMPVMTIGALDGAVIKYLPFYNWRELEWS